MLHAEIETKLKTDLAVAATTELQAKIFQGE